MVSTVELFSTDLGMEFWIKKCGTLVLKRGKVVRSDVLEFPSAEQVQTVEEGGYKYISGVSGQ